MKKLSVLYILFGVAVVLRAQETSTAKTKSMDDATKQKLVLAQQKTKALFKVVEDRGLIVPGKSERVLNAEIVKIAKDEFGMETHWHKKIVRAGVNTLETYSKDPADRTIQENDIVILDYGPNFDGWETDLGRTFVIGKDQAMVKLKKDVEDAWVEAKAWYNKKTNLTGAEYFNYLVSLAKRYGYEFGGEIGGHIIGRFPHEQPDLKGDLSLDVHPGNNNSILLLDKNGNRRQWVLEVHFVDKAKGIGAFYEDMLN